MLVATHFGSQKDEQKHPIPGKSVAYFTPFFSIFLSTGKFLLGAARLKNLFLCISSVISPISYCLLRNFPGNVYLDVCLFVVNCQ
jgi:hypothetical protein